ncbi:MAG: V-type ATP synthase subunit F [bacterium]
MSISHGEGKIAFIGDHDSILGFTALGLDTFQTTDPKEAGEILSGLFKEGYAAVYITEQLARDISPLIRELSSRHVLPCVVMIPNIEGTTGIGLEKVRRMVEKAVGKDILGRRE